MSTDTHTHTKQQLEVNTRNTQHENLSDHSHEALLYLQSWRTAPGWWRGRWPCQRADLAPPHLPETQLDLLTPQHWAWNKQKHTEQTI